MTTENSVPADAEATDRRNQASYNSEAARYDRIRFSTPRRKYYVDFANETIARLIRFQRGMRVLDVATGTGRVAIELARRGGEVTGVDLTEAMLAEAAAKAREEGVKNVVFRVANARELPFPDGSFDAVTAIRFFHLLPFELQRAILAELYRVVQPGGRVVIEFNNPFSGVMLRPLIDVWIRARRGYWGGRLWPQQHAPLFAGHPVVQKRGLWFLGQGHLWQVSGGLAAAMDRLADHSPFRFFTEQLLVVIEKPAAKA